MTNRERAVRPTHRLCAGLASIVLALVIAIGVGGDRPASADGGIVDCNANGVPDTEEIFTFPPASTVVPLQVPGSPAPSTFAGPPDDSTAGLGEMGLVVFDFGANALVDAIGPDLNVYESSFGGAEFGFITVTVSVDGVNFVDVTATEGPVVPLGGDEGHLGNARSYNLDGSGFAAVRAVVITAIGGGGGNGFDLDAIGIINGFDCNDNGSIDSCEIAADPGLDIDADGVLDECLPPVCPGDTNADGVVNIDDIVNVILDFGTPGTAHGGDVNESGFVDIDDIVFVILNFGDSCICKLCST